ncbi:hypothetical protein LTR70_003026 [Exophiala xenobiotica]|uniref:Uncharacterized protein n=1 Tax=Lithohypha guttulata TaxID=1690604 RepID=A0ABR0K8H8_9EURO|nr:hypothetical protein LTR24_005706 [Lithohypha guttulata]KAK5324396.1 hypothetical protein LTR70_003026 [Exophiala xenobiotica]
MEYTDDDLMLRPARSLRSSTNVITTPPGALCASPLHILKTKTRSLLQPQLYLPEHPRLNARSFSTTHPRPSPTATSPRQVSVFLPHEDLKLKARAAKAQPAPPTSTSPSSTRPTTSIIAAHHDLPTYLRSHLARLKSQPDATKRAKLSASSVFLGTRYEYIIQRHLQTGLGFHLTRIGGKGDGGVDLIGTWSLPDPLGSGSGSGRPSETGFKVLLQAKRLAAHRKPSPALMRELEGTLMGFPSSRPLQEAFAAHRIRIASGRSRSSSSLSESSNGSNPTTSPEGNPTPPSDTSDQPTLGILVTTNPLTDGVEKAMASSRRCLMYMCLEEGLSTATTGVPVATDDDSASVSGLAPGLVPTTRLKQIAWNAAAAQAGLEGYDVVTKYSDATIEGVGGVNGEATLMYRGRPVQFPK